MGVRNKRVKRSKPNRQELLGVCKRVLDICRHFHPGIHCEVTPVMKELELAARIEAEKADYEYSQNQNLGYCYVFLSIPPGLKINSQQLVEQITALGEVANVFLSCSHGEAGRFKNSVRSDDADMTDR